MKGKMTVTKNQIAIVLNTEETDCNPELFKIMSGDHVREVDVRISIDELRLTGCMPNSFNCYLGLNGSGDGLVREVTVPFLDRIITEKNIHELI